MTDARNFQIENIDKIFVEGRFSPIFRENEKYPTKLTPRISYDDVMNYKFVIRGCDESFAGRFWTGSTEVIASYQNIEQLVDDGWRLD